MPKPKSGKREKREKIDNIESTDDYKKEEVENIERQRIKNTYYKVSPQKQARHIEGTKEYEQYKEKSMKSFNKMPSVLYNTENPQNLIDIYKGTGVIKRVKDGTIREFIQADHGIGMYWESNKSEYISTNVACIIYSKKDAHIYPVWEGKIKNEGK